MCTEARNRFCLSLSDETCDENDDVRCNYVGFAHRKNRKYNETSFAGETMFARLIARSREVSSTLKYFLATFAFVKKMYGLQEEKEIGYKK